MGKQAVLLIHGIGEQRPMQTLRSFVDAVWTSDTASHRTKGENRAGLWSKPYGLAENFELRRLTTAENLNGRRTDFFEFYWAHLMQGTQLWQVLSWLAGLLLRSPARLPAQLRSAYGLLWMSLLAAAGWVAWALLQPEQPPLWRLLNSAWALPVLALAAYIAREIVGDAARYLDAAPANVQTRHAIRAAGLKALRALHCSGEYERIIVVGHSLGTVIGYDILKHGWAAFGAAEPLADDQPRLGELEALAGSQALDIDAWQAAQRRCAQELAATQRWRVSDFVTLGSPLAHAALLLAADAKELEKAIALRELPSCPPVREGQRFSYQSGGKRRLHHAALFGPTRWTNLFFPQKWVIFGDLIGGPVAPVFGPGVRDVDVKSSRWWGLLSHTFYWRPHGKDQHVQKLREALDLLDVRHQG